MTAILSHFLSAIFRLDGIGEELVANDRMKRVMQDLVVDPDSDPEFQLQQGKLKYKGCLVLAKWSPRIPNILVEFHDSPVGGHSG